MLRAPGTVAPPPARGQSALPPAAAPPRSAVPPPPPPPHLRARSARPGPAPPLQRRRRAPRAVAAAAAASFADAFADAWGAAPLRREGLPDEATLAALPLRALAAAVNTLAAAASSADDVADLLPSSTYLLALRDAAGAQLADFPPQALTALLAGLAALPLRVENSPLPVGFGTPRWALPRAVADPAAWDAFLARAADAFADALLARASAPGCGGGGGSGGGDGGGGGGDGGPGAPGAPASALVTPFVLALAGAQQWALAHVDAEWVASRECSARVAAFVAAHWPRLLARLRQLDAAADAEAAADAGGGDAERAAHEVRAAAARRAAVATFLSRAALHARLQPPTAQLERFFNFAPPELRDGGGGDAPDGGACDVEDSSAPSLGTGYSLEELEAVVRTLLVVGHSPPEPWLLALAAVVCRAREGMEPQQLRGFVEGLRWGGPQAGGLGDGGRAGRRKQAQLLWAKAAGGH
jgi:hypothetical protein